MPQAVAERSHGETGWDQTKHADRRPATDEELVRAFVRAHVQEQRDLRR